MVPVKIQCGCGQQYEFEVEPLAGRMPGPVACPVCGADGTEAGNEALAHKAAVRAMTPTLRVGVASPASTAVPRRPAGPLPGQTDRTQATVQARAKVSWGESKVDVMGYLRGQGLSQQETAELVDELFRERAAEIRGRGIRNLLCGIMLICVPIVAVCFFMFAGYIEVKTLLVTIIVGFIGLWLVIKGVGMLLSPNSEKGDVADQ